MRKAFVIAVVASFVGLVACAASQGDSCDKEGKVEGECDDGLVCGHAKSDNSGSLVCLKQCVAQTDCAGDEECNGVGGTSLKGCRKR